MTGHLHWRTYILCFFGDVLPIFLMEAISTRLDALLHVVSDLHTFDLDCKSERELQGKHRQTSDWKGG